MGNFTHIINQLFSKRNKSCIPVYLKRFETIDTLIGDDRIGIDIVRNLVVLDTSIHLLYMDDDNKYNAFFDTLRAYINYHRGRLQIRRMVEPEDRIDFMVVQKLYMAFDLEKGEFYDKPQESAQTLIVGYYQNGKVDYVPYKAEE